MTSPENLINKIATAYTIPSNVVRGMKALIIADAHFDKTLSLSSTLPKYIKELGRIIAKEKVNTVFVLGDMLQNDDDMTIEKLKSIIKGFEYLPVRVYIIGGNHDRSMLWELKYNKQGSNVKVIYDLAMLLVHPNPAPGTPPRIFLAHDLKNNFQLKPEEGQYFVKNLKSSFKDMIRSEDYLLVGHTHQTIDFKELRCGSIGAYSEDLYRKSYAILNTENGFEFTFRGK
jgi:predicted phosphodiesterase